MITSLLLALCGGGQSVDPPDFRLRKNHFDLFGTKKPKKYKEILHAFRDNCLAMATEEERLDFLRQFACLIEYYSIVNIDYKLGKDEFHNPKISALISSIDEIGQKKPVIAHDLPKCHPYWVKKKRHYEPDCYYVKDGRHRASACQFLELPVLAIVLELQP